MEQTGTVSLRPKGRNQQAQVTWPEDRSGGRGQRIRQEGGETQKGNRKEEKPDWAEETSERRE